MVPWLRMPDRATRPSGRSSGRTVIPPGSISRPQSPTRRARYQPVAQFRFDAAPCRVQASCSSGNPSSIRNSGAYPSRPSTSFIAPSHRTISALRPARRSTVRAYTSQCGYHDPDTVSASAFRSHSGSNLMPNRAQRWREMNSPASCNLPRISGSPSGEWRKRRVKTGKLAFRSPVSRSTESIQKFFPAS